MKSRLIPLLSLAIVSFSLFSCGSNSEINETSIENSSSFKNNQLNNDAKLNDTNIGSEIDSVSLSHSETNTAETQIVGDWHCIDTNMPEASNLEESGYRLGAMITIHFNDDGSGSLQIIDSAGVSFMWNKNGDNTYTLDSFEYEELSGSVSFSDSQLQVVLFNSSNNESLFFDFENGLLDNADKDVSAYWNKAHLKLANVNAKLLFTTVNNQLADMVAEGEMDGISGCCSGQLVRVDSLSNSDNPIDVAIYNTLMDNAAGDGYIYFELSEDGYFNVLFAQWSENEDSGIVGQYPEPETDPEAVHVLGEVY